MRQVFAVVAALVHSRTLAVVDVSGLVFTLAHVLAAKRTARVATQVIRVTGTQVVLHITAAAIIALRAGGAGQAAGIRARVMLAKLLLRAALAWRIFSLGHAIRALPARHAGRVLRSWRILRDGVGITAHRLAAAFGHRTGLVELAPFGGLAIDIDRVVAVEHADGGIRLDVVDPHGDQDMAPANRLLVKPGARIRNAHLDQRSQQAARGGPGCDAQAGPGQGRYDRAGGDHRAEPGDGQGTQAHQQAANPA